MLITRIIRGQTAKLVSHICVTLRDVWAGLKKIAIHAIVPVVMMVITAGVIWTVFFSNDWMTVALTYIGGTIFGLGFLAIGLGLCAVILYGCWKLIIAIIQWAILLPDNTVNWFNELAAEYQ